MVFLEPDKFVIVAYLYFCYQDYSSSQTNMMINGFRFLSASHMKKISFNGAQLSHKEISIVRLRRA